MTDTYIIPTRDDSKESARKLVRQIEKMAFLAGVDFDIVAKKRREDYYLYEFVISGDSLAIKDFDRRFWNWILE